MIEFEPFQKIPRLSRDCVITEKIDGTNASVFIGEDGEFLTASRTRWITPDNDNFGFSAWAHENRDNLMALGPGHHFGEWWGAGIQRNYGLEEKRFSLFNTERWDQPLFPGCTVVPVLYQGIFDSSWVSECLDSLVMYGSAAAPGFLDPEGIIIYHTALNGYFKKTIKKDEEWKGKNK